MMGILDDTDLAVMWQSAPVYVRQRASGRGPRYDDGPGDHATDGVGGDRADGPAGDRADGPAGDRADGPAGGVATGTSAGDSAGTGLEAGTNVMAGTGLEAGTNVMTDDDTDLEQLGHHIRSLAADIAATTYRWLRLIERFDRQGGWEGVGIASCAAWLSWTCSIAPATAREYVRIARALPALPLISSAFAAGALSYSKVRILVKVAADVDERVLLEQARIQTVSQLERTVRAFRRGDGWQQEHERRASWRWDDDGMLVLSARLPADEGALLIAALNQVQDEQYDERDAPSGPAPVAAIPVAPDPREGSRADALVGLARRALAVGAVDSSGDDRHLVVVHVDMDQLTEGPAAGDDDGTATDSDDDGSATAHSGLPGPRCHLENGPGLDRRTAARISCDTALLTVIHQVGEGEPLRLGRKTRKIPPALRRALRIRDVGCVFPGCHRRSHLHAHHVVPWSRGGPTNLENLALLCRSHHVLVHEGGFTMTAGDPGSATDWVLRDRLGHPIAAPPPPPTPGPDRDPIPATAPDGLLPAWRGEPFQLVETVAVLAGAARVGA